MEAGTNKKTIIRWTDNELASFFRFLPPLKHKLYSKVSEKLTEKGCKHILDYGCGEGNQIAFLDKELKIDLYDINHSFSLSAFNKYKNSHKFLGHKIDANELLPNSYDAIVVNMVWMCLKDECEVDTLLENLLKIKRKDGIIFLSITNPYSRDLDFSYYETDYSRGKKTFNYFNNGEAFDVFIKNEPHTVFTDFHWTMEFMLEKTRDRNLILEEYIELEDEPLNGFSNPKLSPYILLVLK